jgi:hypothetical protein
MTIAVTTGMAIQHRYEYAVKNDTGIDTRNAPASTPVRTMALGNIPGGCPGGTNDSGGSRGP